MNRQAAIATVFLGCVAQGDPAAAIETELGGETTGSGVESSESGSGGGATTSSGVSTSQTPTTSTADTSSGTGSETGVPGECDDVPPPVDGTSPLAVLAAALEPGAWGILQDNTDDLVSSLGDTGSSGHIVTFSTNGKYNPNSGEIFLIGGDHNGGVERFVSYSEADNLWSIRPNPPFISADDFPQNHGYDYDALDPDGQRYTYVTRQYDIETCSWTELPGDGLADFGRAQGAFEYFPGRGLVAVAYQGGTQSGIYLLEDGAASWRELGTIDNAIDPHACGGCDPVAKYSPALDLMLVGGSDGSDRLWRLEGEAGAETLTPLGETPLTQIAVSWGVLVADPLTGRYLYLDEDVALWELDVAADTWSPVATQDSPLPAFSAFFSPDDATAMPIAQYGVTLWILFDGADDNAKVAVYKHHC